MIKKIIRKTSLKDKNSDLDYWLSRPSSERIEAVEILRRQWIGSSARLEKTIKLLNKNESES